MFKALAGRVALIRPRAALFYTAGLIGVIYLFFWRLGSLTPGLSDAGAANLTASQSWHYIFDHPINAPYNALQHLIVSLAHAGHFYDRLAAALIALFFVFMFYKLAVGWFGLASGLMGTILFVCTPLFLISAHQSAPYIMYFWPVALMTAYWWLTRAGRHKDLALMFLALIGGLAIYTPGLVWVLLGGIIIGHKRLAAVISKLQPAIVASGIVLIGLLLATLIIACVRDPSTLKQLALIPANLTSVGSAFKDIGWMTLAVFAKSPTHQSLVIGRLPVLDVIQTAFLVFGVYAMFSAAAKKAYPLLAVVFFAIIMAGLNDNLAVLGIALPALAIFICAGLRFLYIEWRGIFPRNPLPKSLAVLLMALVVLMSAIYGIRYSLTAWPHTDATRKAYVLK